MKNKKNKNTVKKQIVKKSHPADYAHEMFDAIKKDKIDFLFIFIASSCFLGFGIYHLGKFFTTDEVVWLYKRYPMYWNSFLNGDWGRFENFGAQSGILQILLSGWMFFAKNTAAYDYSNFELFLFKWRLPLLIFNYLLLFIIFDRVRRLWGNRIAVTNIVFITFFPYLVGISQIFSKDTTLWSTAFISILNFYLYLKTKQYRFAIYSGLFLGLALLSKFPASILYPLYFGFIYLEYLFHDTNRSRFIHSLKAYVLSTGISMFIVFIALPPSWFDIRLLLDWTWYSKVIDHYTDYILLSMAFLSFEILALKGVISKNVNVYNFLKTWIPRILFGIFFVCLCFMAIIQLLNIEDHFEFLNRNIGAGLLIQTFPRAFFAGFRNIVKGTPLIHFIGISGFIILMLKNAMSYTHYRFFFYSMVLIMVYYLGAALSGAELSLRYQIILLPIFCLFASYFFVTIFRRRFYLYLTILFVILALEMLHVAPFYITYRNPTEFSSFINPGVNWGQGGYEIAQSVNRLQNAEEMKILSDYEGFAKFFRGAGSRYTYRQKLTENYIRQYDYLCLSSIGYRQIIRYNAMTQDFKKYYEQPLENAVSYIGNKQNYVKLVRVDS
ncbi:MAG: glycosyltransferase family 39 protein [Desulfobacteraceae bacterium]|nr:glycosyltransferase family 39 protein [Desulfobacteraceae bacterium]MBC2757886.1 glycosyltransferase family 39 protein [Desulfobacteraceae bacterium]